MRTACQCWSWHIITARVCVCVCVCAGSDNKIFIWNVGMGEVLCEVDFADIPLSCSWNWDGSRFAVACKDHKLRIVEPRTGKILRVRTCHEPRRASTHSHRMHALHCIAVTCGAMQHRNVPHYTASTVNNLNSVVCLSLCTSRIHTARNLQITETLILILNTRWRR